MRRAVRRQNIARSASVPAPVKGWNAKESIAEMQPDSALIMDNIFPNLENCTLRRGFAEHATGIGGPVETLAEYAGPATQKLLACGQGGIYDATVSGAVGAALQSGLTNDRWQTTMFGTAGGSFLYFVNGVDAPRYYDGTSFTIPTLSGVTATDIVHVMAHRQRLFFLFNNSLSFGYLPVSSVAGTVSTFDLGSIFRKGGSLITFGSWSRDGGSGPDDLAVFITSNGEVAVYAGNDPGTASSWSLVGVFSIGGPIGRRSVMRLGADLIIVTQDGYVPLSQMLPIDRVGAQSKAFSDMIQNAVVSDARTYGALFGWQAILYPKGSYALFNVPQSSTVSCQHVVNTQTGAWCRFKGQNALCWSLYNQNLFFGGPNGNVYKADIGTSDNGANITFDLKPAFSYFGGRGQKKLFTAIRPLYQSNGPLPLSISLNIDFADEAATNIPVAPPANGFVWGVSLWGQGNWTGPSLYDSWLTVQGIGFAATPRVQGATNSMTFEWASYDMTWQAGGII